MHLGTWKSSEMTPRRKASDVVVAKSTFVASVDGESVRVWAGVTHLRADHPLVKRLPDLFQGAGPRPDIEQATAAPGGEAWGAESVATSQSIGRRLLACRPVGSRRARTTSRSRPALLRTGTAADR